MSSLDPIDLLSRRFREAIAAAYPDQPAARDADPIITPSRNPQFGDFQSNAAMPLGKALGKPPREIAGAVLAKLDLSEIAEPLAEPLPLPAPDPLPEPLPLPEPPRSVSAAEVSRR